MEIEEESAAVLLNLPAAYEDEPMEGGSIDDYSSHKSIREEEEPSDSITARKKQRIIIEQEEKTKLTVDEDLEDPEGDNYDSDSDYDEQEDKAEKEEERQEDEEEDIEVRKEKNVAILFNCRDKYPEAYNHIMYLSSIALQDYNKKWSTAFVVLAVKKVYSTWPRAIYYELTFTAAYPGVTDDEKTFKATLWYDIPDTSIKVVTCDIIEQPDTTPSSIPPHTHNYSLGEKEPSDNSQFNQQSDPLELISTLITLSDDVLLAKIKNYCRTHQDQHLVLNKVRKYFQSVIQSKGFKCSYFPGHIPGITDFKPREKLIYNADLYLLGINHLHIMAILALGYYIKDKGTNHGYVGVGVENANMWKESSCSYVYYVTFRAIKEGLTYVYAKERKLIEYFEAKVRDKQRDIDVLFCKKLGA